MITCEHAQNLLEAYLNDELSPALVSEVDAHCLGCASCRQQLSLMEACGNVVRLDLSEPEVSGDFTERLTAIMESSPDRRTSMQIGRWTKVAGALVGVAAMIGLVVVLRPTPGIHSGVLGQTSGEKPDDTSMFQKGVTGWGVPGSFFEFLSGADSFLEAGDITANKMNDAAESENRAPVEHLPGAPLPERERRSPFQPFPELEDKGDPDDGGELI